MNIGQTARESGLTVKSIRYYETIKLVVPRRRQNGYRDYADFQVEQLKQVRRARKIGFSAEECRSLVDAYNTNGDSVTVEDKLPEGPSVTANIATDGAAGSASNVKSAGSIAATNQDQGAGVTATVSESSSSTQTGPTQNSEATNEHLAKCLEKVDAKEDELARARAEIVLLIETARKNPRAIIAN